MRLHALVSAHAFMLPRLQVYVDHGEKFDHDALQEFNRQNRISEVTEEEIIPFGIWCLTDCHLSSVCFSIIRFLFPQPLGLVSIKLQ